MNSGLTVSETMALTNTSAAVVGQGTKKEQELAKAIRDLDERIDEIRRNPNLSRQDRDNLIDTLTRAKSSGNVAAIYTTLTAVSMQTQAATASETYKVTMQMAMASEYARLDAVTRAHIDIRSRYIDLNDEKSIQAFANTYEHPDEVVSLLKQNAPLVEKYNGLTPQARKEEQTRIAVNKQMTANLLNEHTSGPAHDLLSKVKEHRLYRFPEMDDALRDLAQAKGPQAITEAIQELRESVVKAEKKHNAFKAAHPTPKGMHANSMEAIEGIAVAVDRVYHGLGRQNSLKSGFALAGINNNSSLGATNASMDDRINALVRVTKEQHPGVRLDDAELRKAAGAYIEKIDTKQVKPIAVNLDKILHDSMLKGYNAMIAGDASVATRFADDIERLMLRNGYPADRAHMVGDTLRKGAQVGSSDVGQLALKAMGPERAIESTLSDLKQIVATGKSTLWIDTINVGGDAVKSFNGMVNGAADFGGSVLNAMTGNTTVTAKPVATVNGQVLAAAKKEFDLNGDGKLSVDEIKKTMAANHVSYEKFAGKDGVMSNEELIRAAGAIPNKPAPKAHSH